MEKLPPFRGIGRDEYLASVRLCPKHPAFAVGYQEWTRTTLLEIRKICNSGRIAAIKRR